MDYDSDSTEYYPDLDNPNSIIVELSRSVVYIDRDFSKIELLNYIKLEILKLNIEINNTQNENLKIDLYNFKELYFYVLNNYM